MFSHTIIRALIVAAVAAAPAAANARLIDPSEGAAGLDPAIATAISGHATADAASIALDPAISRAIGNRRAAHHAAMIPLDPAIQAALGERRAKTVLSRGRIYFHRLPLAR